jgi:hypothetical protein
MQVVQSDDRKLFLASAPGGATAENEPFFDSIFELVRHYTAHNLPGTCVTLKAALF